VTANHIVPSKIVTSNNFIQNSPQRNASVNAADRGLQIRIVGSTGEVRMAEGFPQLR
jgi:hypothetical protein